MSTFSCWACGLPLRLRRDREGDTFWACTSRTGCGITWPGDEERPRGTGELDGEKLVPYLERAQHRAFLALQVLDLWKEAGREEEHGRLARAIYSATDLLELGEVRKEIREIRERREA